MGVGSRKPGLLGRAAEETMRGRPLRTSEDGKCELLEVRRVGAVFFPEVMEQLPLRACPVLA